MKPNYSWLILILQLSCILAEQFIEIIAPLCIRNQFIETSANARSAAECGIRCASHDRCQAFNMLNGGLCQLFVFDKCSKYVRDCGAACTRTGRVFVKQRPGLPAGALCPVGFDDDLCGTKYKLVNTISWNGYKSVADAQAGLVIMSDLLNEIELAHLYNMSVKYGWSAVMLGGIQDPGSAEPSGGFRWVGCNTELSGNSGLWSVNEPNNWAGVERVVVSEKVKNGKLVDDKESNSYYTGGLLKCVSPFD